jgi:hypothetical protein
MASTERLQFCETESAQGSLTARAQAPVSRRPAVRDAALDIVKGVCVIVMVLYHSVGYFPESPLSLSYSAFVTGAFILLAGFVSTNIYLAKYDLRSDWFSICRRLGVRGIKLILLAIVLNLALVQLFPHVDGKQRADAVTTLRNLLLGIHYHSVSFDLLVLIGYSLLATTVLLAVGRGSAVLLIPFAACAVVYAVISNYNQWPGDYYARLFAIGQTGAALGLFRQTTVMNVGSRLDWVLLLYFAQLLALPLLPPNSLLYAFHVICTILAIYSIASKCDPNTWLCRKLSLLGKYSLLSYLFQIAFLQLVRHVWNLTDEGVAFAFILTCVATLICVELTEKLRSAFKWVEGPYRFVFC